jgi:hypothetical protein
MLTKKKKKPQGGIFASVAFLYCRNNIPTLHCIRRKEVIMIYSPSAQGV